MPKNQQVFQPDDRLFRKMMEDRENVRAYLEQFFPRIAEMADLDTLQQENTANLHSDLKLFQSDVIYRCRFKGKEDRHFYFSLLFEHKSAPDEHVSIQVGLYVMLLMHKMSRQKNRKVEPVIPLIFYNGKKAWKPKTLRQLFDKHPYFEKLQTFIPDFSFLFKDIAREPIERILDIQMSYFRSLLLAMAMRHQQDLILSYISVIFDLKNREQLQTAVIYFLAIIERSPKEFMEELKNIEFTTKAETMSTLEMLLEQGRQEGIEQGELKANVLMLLRLSLKFSEMPVKDLSNLTQLSVDAIEHFIMLKKEGDKLKMEKYIQNYLLKNISVKDGEWSVFDQLIKEM